MGTSMCVMAYGQTGSGKTYSMLGSGWEDGASGLSASREFGSSSERLQPAAPLGESDGVIPRSVHELFSVLEEASQKSSGDLDYSVHCQFMQIYNEKIYDLLADKNMARPLPLRGLLAPGRHRAAARAPRDRSLLGAAPARPGMRGRG